MSYCSTCGHELIAKECEHEGMIPYCESCKEFRFPMFNTAVSMIVVNPDKNKVLMIQQYGRPNNILVAGYVNKGEALEEAVIRELKEEIGLNVRSLCYLKSEYFENSNSLICNFAVMTDSESLQDVSEWEVDMAQWFSFEEAKEAVKPCSLAQRFLYNFFKHEEDIIEHLT